MPGSRGSILLTTRNSPNVSSGFSLPLTFGVQGLAHHSGWGPWGAGDLGAACSSGGWPDPSRRATPPSTLLPREGWRVLSLGFLHWGNLFPHKMMPCAYSLQLQEGGLTLAIRSGCLLRRGRNKAVTEVLGVPPAYGTFSFLSVQLPHLGSGWGGGCSSGGYTKPGPWVLNYKTPAWLLGLPLRSCREK